MSARVLLIVLTSWGKEINARLTEYRKEFNKFNNTRARMLDSIYYKMAGFI